MDKIIEECGGSVTQGYSTGSEQEFLSYKEREDVEKEDIDMEVDDTALSADHQLILSCCWQTMKVSSPSYTLCS